MQARYYDADLGVFLSIDPMPTTPGNLFNFGRYGYANANPLSFVDPDGQVAMAAVWLDGYSVSGGGGGRQIFFRPPSDNWWHGIERPKIGDYPGLIGGGGNRPNKPTELEEIKVTAPRAPDTKWIRWSGNVWSLNVDLVGIAAGWHRFDLVSECVSGQASFARISIGAHSAEVWVYRYRRRGLRSTFSAPPQTRQTSRESQSS